MAQWGTATTAGVFLSNSVTGTTRIEDHGGRCTDLHASGSVQHYADPESCCRHQSSRVPFSATLPVSKRRQQPPRILMITSRGRGQSRKRVAGEHRLAYLGRNRDGAAISRRRKEFLRHASDRSLRESSSYASTIVGRRLNGIHACINALVALGWGIVRSEGRSPPG